MPGQPLEAAEFEFCYTVYSPSVSDFGLCVQRPLDGAEFELCYNVYINSPCFRFGTSCPDDHWKAQSLSSALHCV